LEYTAVFHEYEQLFDQYLEEFAEKEGFAVKEFEEVCSSLQFFP
jgi:hypothetical protein